MAPFSVYCRSCDRILCTESNPERSCRLPHVELIARRTLRFWEGFTQSFNSPQLRPCVLQIPRPAENAFHVTPARLYAEGI